MRTYRMTIPSKRKVKKLLLILLIFILLLLIIRLRLLSCDSRLKISNPEENSTFNSVTNKSFYPDCYITPPAIVLVTKGGIGNQLFQYACLYALARKHNWPLYIYAPSSITSDSKRKFSADKREFALDKFHVPLFGSNVKNWSLVLAWVYRLTNSDLHTGQYPKNRVIKLHLDSYCISDKFFNFNPQFEKELMDIFKMKIPTKPIQKWIDLIESKGKGSVALHFRQGDILKKNISVPSSFYFKAMDQISKMMKDRPTFFIFSEDAESAYSQLSASNVTSEKIIISHSNLTSLQEFNLMSRCKHFIIPRSTFSWWAAYLSQNPEKIVIAADYDNHTLEYLFENDHEKAKEYRNDFYPTHWNIIRTD